MLLLRKCVYPYEYIGDWEKFSELYYSGFYSELNMEDITDADYSHTKWLC